MSIIGMIISLQATRNSAEQSAATDEQYAGVEILEVEEAVAL